MAVFVLTAISLGGMVLIASWIAFDKNKDNLPTKTLIYQSENPSPFWWGLSIAAFCSCLGFCFLSKAVANTIEIEYAIGLNAGSFAFACVLFMSSAFIFISVSCATKAKERRLNKRLGMENKDLESFRSGDRKTDDRLQEKYQTLVKDYEKVLQQRNECRVLYANLQKQFQKTNEDDQQEETGYSNDYLRESLLGIIRAERNDLRSKCERQEQEIKDLQIQLSIVSSELKNKKISSETRRSESEMPKLDQQENLHDYAFYEGIYDLFPSDEIKLKLNEIRDSQKNMLQENHAAYCLHQFKVDGSIVEGRKVTKAVIKQAIGAFNAECDLLISQVKFYNIERIKNRIVWSYNKINKENEATNVEISEGYLQLKLDEVSAVFEYARKKKEEADYAKEQRAIAREEARVMKELEEERARIEKEQTHYENRLARLEEQLAAEESEPRKELIKETITAVKEEIVDLDKALKEVDYRQANQRAGYVYVISNVGSFGEGVYKIGMTRRLQPEDRVDELGGASVPFRFDTHAMIFSKDAPALETALHNEFRDRRVNMVNGRKEFFRVPLDEIERVVNKYHDKTVKFDYTPIAEQYRETQKLIERSSV